MTPPGGFGSQLFAQLLQTSEWTFSRDVDVFVGVAGIAGVFVGFAALIGISRHDEFETGRFADVRGVVSIGLLLIVAALVPIVLSRYGLVDHTLWVTSSVVFLGLLWAALFFGLRRPENREVMRAQAQGAPTLNLFFWVGLEIPIHVPLILTILGRFPDLEPAFYLTALVFQLFEAAYVLSDLVYRRVDAPT